MPGNSALDLAKATLHVERVAKLVPGTDPEIAFYDGDVHSWRKMPAEAVELERKSLGDKIYIRAKDRDAVYVLANPALRPKPGKFDCLKSYDTDLAGIYRKDILGTKICIDQTATGRPQITHNTNNIVTPNYYQILLVRHWDDVVPVVTYDGARVAFVAAGYEELKKGEGTSAPATGNPAPGNPLQGRAIVHAEDGWSVSAFVIAPHEPGYSRLQVEFFSTNSLPDSVAPAAGTTPPAAATASPTNKIGIDVITDQAYSGALRLGVGFATSPIHRYSRFEATTGAQPEIHEDTGRPLEVVVGYAVYLDYLFCGGRTYNVFRCSALRHMSLFFGVSALGYDGAKADYLRSIYTGLEFEAGRNISVAVGLNLRRDDELDGAFIGGPIPPSGIPTRTRIAPGLGIVFNVSSEFFEFALEHVKQ